MPTIPAGAITAALGVVGAIIMPHNLYLHSSLVLTRKVDTNNPNKVNEANIYNTIESAFSLTISFLINMAVIATFAVYVRSQYFENDPQDIDLRSASAALAGSFGENAKYIWAVGLLAAGQSSTMTGTYAGQFVMEGFLEIKLPIYQRILITRSIAIIPAISVTFMNESAMTNMDTYLNILQSVQLPFALVPLIKFVSSPEIMNSFAISRVQVIISTTLGLMLFSMNFVTIFIDSSLDKWWQFFIIGLVGVFYVMFLANAVMEPVSTLKQQSREELEDHEYEKINVEDEDF